MPMCHPDAVVMLQPAVVGLQGTRFGLGATELAGAGQIFIVPKLVSLLSGSWKSSIDCMRPIHVAWSGGGWEGGEIVVRVRSCCRRD